MSQNGLQTAWQCNLNNRCHCDPSEPFSVVKTVDDYREYWHPNYPQWIKSGKSLKTAEIGDHPQGGVNVLLLAESHVCTSAKVHSIKFDPKSIIKMPQPSGIMPHVGYPDNFVQFVYNLGYGENTLYIPPHGTRKTIGFWTLFAVCSRGGYSSKTRYLNKTSNPNRIKNKVALLKELQLRGIWLLDASVNGKGPKCAGKGNYDQFIKCSWCYSTSNRINVEKPRHIVIIGKDVKNALSRITCNGGTPPYQHNRFVGQHKIEIGYLFGFPTTVIDQPASGLPGRWDPKSNSPRGNQIKKLHDICKKYAP